MNSYSLYAGYTYLLRVLIGSLDSMSPVIGQSNTLGSGFQHSVENCSRVVSNFVEVKPTRPKMPLWAITKDIDNLLNPPKLEANTCSARAAREAVYEQGMIGFDFTSDWLKK